MKFSSTPRGEEQPRQAAPDSPTCVSVGCSVTAVVTRGGDECTKWKIHVQGRHGPCSAGAHAGCPEEKANKASKQ